MSGIISYQVFQDDKRLLLESDSEEECLEYIRKVNQEMYDRGFATRLGDKGWTLYVFDGDRTGHELLNVKIKCIDSRERSNKNGIDLTFLLQKK